jgi:thymidine kinase
MDFSSTTGRLLLDDFPKSPDKFGELQLIIGPMFSGKSTELLRRIEIYSISNKKTILIKYYKDTRYSESSISTHNKQTKDAIPASSIGEILDILMEYDVIGIDEGQFFSDILEVEKLANNGKIVIIAALDATFQRLPFNKICELVPRCEKVIKLNAVCMDCFSPASFSKRITDEKEVEIIGGKEKYKPVCRRCYFKN